MKQKRYSTDHSSFKDFMQPVVNEVVKYVAREACHALLDAINRKEKSERSNYRPPLIPGHVNDAANSYND